MNLRLGYKHKRCIWINGIQIEDCKWFANGSQIWMNGTRSKIWECRPELEHVQPMVAYSQWETTALIECVRENLRFEYRDKNIFIYTDTDCYRITTQLGGGGFYNVTLCRISDQWVGMNVNRASADSIWAVLWHLQEVVYRRLQQ